ncbi:MAG TPA: MbnP family copper-binding protein [Polyangiales bacterium]|nr:MbnP family copper-binding protein [Polyangiales bacterium]
MQLRVATTCLVLVTMLGCGDDDDQAAADGGRDSGSSEHPRAGQGGSGGKSGAGGTKPAAGAGGMSSPADDAGASDLQSVTIRFQAKFGERDLDCDASYTLPSLGTTSIRPADFRFFVQEVRLISASGHEEPVIFDDRPPAQTRDVALIDLTEQTGPCRSGTSALNTTITGKVARGTYRGIRFVNGVPESLNHQDLAEAKPPLDDATTNWGWTLGYRFILTGLVVAPGDVTDADGGVAPQAGASVVHVGAVGCSGSTKNGFTCAQPNRNQIALDSFDPEKNVIVADLARVFAGVDLGKPLECHGPSSPACKAPYAALGLNAENGMPLETQSVFRIE